MNEIERAIIKTLCYGDVFEFPLTQSEIIQQLITEKKVTPLTIKNNLTKLHQNGLICQTGSYFHLPKKSKTVSLRTQNLKYSVRKTALAKNIALSLMGLPYISAVFLTGAVAVNNATETDDIDFMIISRPNKLWSCRIGVTLYLELKKLRRRPNDTEASDKICPNLFVDSTALSVPKQMRNLYTAHEVIQVKPLVDPDHFHELFLYENRWIQKFVPHIEIECPTYSPRSVASTIDPFESFARGIQLLYMRHHQTRETVTRKQAYFHPRDTAGIVLEEYEKRCRNYCPS
jgi:hypothetical protein